MTEDDWYDEEKIDREIESRSAERRSDPIKCLVALLKDFWLDNTDEEVRVLWRLRVGTARKYTEDMLWCLDEIVKHPSAGLEKIVREQAGVFLYHDRPGTPALYTDAETLQWISNIATEFRAIYEMEIAKDNNSDDDEN